MSVSSPAGGSGGSGGAVPDRRSRARGLLLGGAVGDALGAAVEFWSWAEIVSRLGPLGVTDLVPAYGRAGAVTDDTQMTVFTAEGLIRAHVRYRSRGITTVPGVVLHAYQRWLRTQGETPPDDTAVDGWLSGESWLHHRRAPGTTCLSALRRVRMAGPYRADNDSKGCGGVMRVAPVGLAMAGPEQSYDTAVELAALTHGHADGQQPAGVLAAAVWLLAHGAASVGEAVRAALDLPAARRPEAAATVAAVSAGLGLAGRGLASPAELDALGGGWVGEEALAMAVACAAAEAPVRSALLAAVNHSGDSDSTGSIAGQLLGTAYGEAGLPADWVAAVEGRETLEALADDLAAEFDPDADPGREWEPDDGWRERYPGW
ncbi:MAG: ADP-ribosylglycohydrolase family protein [Candidatus Nanopelagicales bacterium]